MNEFHYGKVGLPREVRNAADLRDALRMYIDKRLLQVSDTCLQHNDDPFRKEYGLINKRSANTLTLVAEATQDVSYLTKSVIEWISEDFNNALTGAQRDAAGICGAELLKIVESYESR